MMEMARVFSAAVAALQGDAGPLALSSSQYIRPDGRSHMQLTAYLLGQLLGQELKNCVVLLHA